MSPVMSTGILPSVSLAMSLEPMYERFPEYEAVAPASRFSPSGAHADGSYAPLVHCGSGSGAGGSPSV